MDIFYGNLSGNGCEASGIDTAIGRENSARAESRYWRFKRCGYKKITLVTCSIVRLQCFVGVLFRLLNLSFDMGVVPMDWRGACIVPLYKQKGDKCECSNSRGISLLSVVGKLFGRVLI